MLRTCLIAIFSSSSPGGAADDTAPGPQQGFNATDVDPERSTAAEAGRLTSNNTVAVIFNRTVIIENENRLDELHVNYSICAWFMTNYGTK